MIRRAPTRNGGFSWARFPVGDTSVVAYRLFRRDQRREVALALRQACHSLRDRVDEIDLVAMEVSA